MPEPIIPDRSPLSHLLGEGSALDRALADYVAAEVCFSESARYATDARRRELADDVTTRAARLAHEIRQYRTRN